MINSIGSADNYANIFNNITNTKYELKALNNQAVNDTVSINSTSMMDEEVEGIFNDIMCDLTVNQTDLASLHSGLNLDRVKSLLSI